ncbi:DNA repair protein RecN [Tissierella sp.]|uniref:DNA repair protein RecN n=1 Tax=Tissierella sp. TaxID=41274 RepID=UPI00286343F6|nr:DNA repair protein RecN [Tissierella sp.]MDR7856153.1 DNA repair protein RecN [Tissierella sp.]
MLIELNIKNFAIIENLKVNFTEGLNIITGETGAGKSILIEAIGIILGSRSNRELIQSGYEKAYLEGIFYIEDAKSIMPLLKEYSIELDDDNILIINKEIYLNGPSLSKINGKTITLNMLKDITKKLVDIFGQHEHQSLLDSSNHQIIIDSFGDSELFKLKSSIKSDYEDLMKDKRLLKNLNIDTKDREREMDILRFHIEEIDDARLTEEDEIDIENEYKKLSNVNSISQYITESLSYVSNEDFGSSNIIDLVDKSTSLINNAKKFDENLLDIHSRFESMAYELRDLNRDLLNYLDSIEIDEERLNFLNDRINLVHKLKKKYGDTIIKINNFRDEAEYKLNELVNFETQIENVNRRISKLEERLSVNSESLSSRRKEISKNIEKNLKSELMDLNMPHVDFKVNFERNMEFTVEGKDKIEFLISTNYGEDLKPLSKIVSGGEISRIMLAFKSILAFFDQIPTMIFDEIDTGISGRTAQIVGEKIQQISQGHQVICISHLPQIAALADSHYVINKVITSDRTKTIVTRLSDKDRVAELARLLGGVNLTDTTLRHASEMIEMSKKLKTNI